MLGPMASSWVYRRYVVKSGSKDQWCMSLGFMFMGVPQVCSEDYSKYQ